MKKRRRHHALLVSAKGTRVKVLVSLRQHWLYEGHCVGDRSRPVSHCLKLPPAYFAVTLTGNAGQSAHELTSCERRLADAST